MRSIAISTSLFLTLALTSCRSPHPIVENVYQECTKAVALADAGDMEGFANSYCAKYLDGEIKAYREHRKDLIKFPAAVYQQERLNISTVLEISQSIIKFLEGNREKFDGITFLKPKLVSTYVMMHVFSAVYPSDYYRNNCRLTGDGRTFCHEDKM